MATADRIVGLDPRGGTTSVAPLLNGMQVEPRQESPSPVRFSARVGALGVRADESFMSDLHGRPIARFLDSLALGSSATVPFGTARDRLARYLAEDRVEGSVADILRDLRRRGFLEVLVDERGRWVGIAKVQPTIWALALQIEGQPAWGVCGTLSLQHWSELHRLGGFYVDRARGGIRLPVIRVAGKLDRELRGFARLETSPSAIVSFSEGLRGIWARAAHTGFEAIDGRATEIEAFHPIHARWRAGSSYQFPTEWTLLRYVDPETGVHQLRSLRSRTSEGVRYRHIADERWGTWIAYASGIQAVEQLLGMSGLAPWALHYEPLLGELWLPERMHLPHALERSLIAASGEPPLEVALARSPSSVGDGLLAMTNGREVGPFDVAYAEMLPDGAEEPWLRYRWVPRELMAAVAEKLECKVKEIRIH